MNKKKWVWIIGFLAALILFSGLLTRTLMQQQQNRFTPGLFIWELPGKADEGTSVAEIVRELNIGEVYCAFDRRELAKKVPESFVREMKEQSVDTWYLMGEPEWGLDPEGKEVCRMIKKLAKYNETVEEDARFVGIMVDIEPYSTLEWKHDKEAVMETWCRALVRARQCASEHNLLMTICIPRWLDEIDSEILEEMIRAGCDRIAIMNYGRKNEVEAIEGEMELADRYGRQVVHISELMEPGQHELTDEQTYYNLGLDAVLESWKNINRNYLKSDLHFAYHHFTPLRKMVER